MIIKREIIGSIVTLVFYFGIISTLFSFGTGMTTESIKRSGIEQSTKADSFAVSVDNFYGYEQ
ncbi:MAG: hypothetical protein H6936_02495 [Burkholderiales bacterium]|nr:hypothetical protein [Nitrosomonas sp.]MCP5273723.1 hypothetical protein [Burkholderiales bacterium]